MADTEAIKKAQEEVDNLDVEKQKEDIDYMISELQKINSTMEDYTKNLEWEKVQEFVKGYDDTYGANISNSLGNLAISVGEIEQNLDPAKFQQTMQNAVEDALSNQVNKIYGAEKTKAQDTLNTAMSELESAAEVLRNMHPGQNGWSEAAATYNTALGKAQSAVTAAREYGLGNSPTHQRVTELGNVDENLRQGYVVSRGQYSNGVGFMGSEGGHYLVENASGTVTNDILQSVLSRTGTDILMYKYDSNTDSYNGPFTLKKALDNEYGKFTGEVLGSKNPTGVLTNYLSRMEDSENAIIWDRTGKDSIAKFVNGALIAMDYKGFDSKQYGVLDYGSMRATNSTYIFNPDATRVTTAIPQYTAAAGSTNFVGGRVYVNELGLEGVITPHGTLTSLPAHTGIVPADLTRNLYDLGEVAPTLVKKYRNEIETVSNSGSSSDNSLNIGEIYTSVNADSDFDFNSLMTSIRQTIGNTRHLPQTQ